MLRVSEVDENGPFVPFPLVQTALLCTVVTEVSFFLDHYLVTTILHYVFSIFIPIYPLIGCLICFIKVRGLQGSFAESLEVAGLGGCLWCVLCSHFRRKITFLLLNKVVWF